MHGDNRLSSKGIAGNQFHQRCNWDRPVSLPACVRIDEAVPGMPAGSGCRAGAKIESVEERTCPSTAVWKHEEGFRVRAADPA